MTQEVNDHARTGPYDLLAEDQGPGRVVPVREDRPADPLRWAREEIVCEATRLLARRASG